MTDGQTDDSGIIIHIIPISHYKQLGVRTREKKTRNTVVIQWSVKVDRTGWWLTVWVQSHCFDASDWQVLSRHRASWTARLVSSSLEVTVARLYHWLTAGTTSAANLQHRQISEHCVKRGRRICAASRSLNVCITSGRSRNYWPMTFTSSSFSTAAL